MARITAILAAALLKENVCRRSGMPRGMADDDDDDDDNGDDGDDDDDDDTLM